ncbi:MAG: hypothetical protein B6245_08575 [Desulfobacteraceae bacterium 4572_88]|nr:MAG: hypothetical protein B6245_08575 [Desulfobacteraceae bacterium 4572_88]
MAENKGSTARSDYQGKRKSETGNIPRTGAFANWWTPVIPPRPRVFSAGIIRRGLPGHPPYPSEGGFPGLV